MPFPWGQSTLPVSFVCPHCGAVHQQLNGTVIHCQCKESEKEKQKERERYKAFIANHNTPKITVREARKLRKAKSTLQ